MLSQRLLSRVVSGRRVSLVRPRQPPRGARTVATVIGSTTFSRRSPLVGAPSSLLCYHDHDYDNNPTLHQQYIQRQQVRWKRKSGVSADDPKPRRFSKKQKKRFRRQLERERDLAKHAAPGSVAGQKREYVEQEKQEMINEYQSRLDGTLPLPGSPLDDPSLEYTASDALLDDLIGNSSYTGAPTPEPIYYGHRQQAFSSRVKNQLEIYQQELQAIETAGTQNKKKKQPKHLLPSDREIALAIKAYRDRHGTKQKPIGIARALQHVLKDLKIPSIQSCFGEYSYNALLSCCRTPKEGLRVFQMMEEKEQPNKHNISKYSWAILMDIHAKVGDFEGCVRVLDGMHEAGHDPNLAAYTSLLAGCYKVCNDGRIAHGIRARAGKVGWEKWQELQIVGLQPDVMCYGAMLRLCAARGKPEQCVNLLEEMPRFDVAPTTLCFTSALKAIAKSHETAIRYERGWSKHNRRRERVTAHHGKMAYDVVLLAESAKVELDDGFVSALQLCAAAAGDSATAKAIYLASKVQRNMKHWRAIGGEEHLARLRGEDPALHSLEGSSTALQVAETDSSTAAIANANIQKRRQGKRMSFGEREYGKDTRTLSAVLRACAQASDKKGVGTMWSGRDNYGYLDLTSLRLIQQYRKPSFRNSDLPGMSRTEFGINTMVDSEDLIKPRKRTDPFLRRGARKKYPGFVTMEGMPSGLYDLPDEQHYDYFDEDGMLKQKYIDSGDYPEFERIQENARYLAAKEAMLELEQSRQERVEQIGEGNLAFDTTSRQIEAGDKLASENADDKEMEVEWYFDADSRKWSTRPKQETAERLDALQQIGGHTQEAIAEDYASESGTEEWNFDDETRRWNTRFVSTQESAHKPLAETTLTDFESRAMEEQRMKSLQFEGNEVDDEAFDEDELDEEEFENAMKAVGKEFGWNGGKFDDPEMEKDFEDFFHQLKQDMIENGEDLSAVSDVEARQLFLVMASEFDASAVDTDDSDDEAEEVKMSAMGRDEPTAGDSTAALAMSRPPPKQAFGQIMQELKDEWGEDGLEIDLDDVSDDELSGDQMMGRTELALEPQPAAWKPGATFQADAGQATTILMEQPEEVETQVDLQDDYGNSTLTETAYRSIQQEEDNPAPEYDFELEELRQLLPGLPDNRLRKIRNAYEEGLSDPSLLTLVPILRETMPDWFTSKSLRASNARNAHFVLERAKEAGLLDVHILNGMLQFYTSAGSLEHALALYDEYREQKLEPTSYSDRLVVQMFLKQKRFHRCLAFKQMVEESGRRLDLLAYGPLIEHCSKHRQLGSAIMFLKECIRVNGAPPGEAYLKELRILCRKEDMEDEVGLEAMIGEDPILWKKHGEAVLKPGKAGNQSHINLARNAMVRA
ncbi:Pentatricopeptide repeat-containing protein [Seminavis robusta]|uniref:Pentatricopeptide repeat-containing protein n=1 Tax=Seminavis robusta TaxID=568900 RepID=A0A9N8DPP2_9STRA|nr:Pentatricopeptide repeat-containing protein [Seminavis robusta]|eukprot:Sro250_g098870.1 Pentatricopeptide repeat-containing protein (1369) ;mRNA; f:44-4597